MRRSSILAASGLAGLALLAGCTTVQPVRVTRFHLDAQVARGQITVEPLLPQDAGSIEFRDYAGIVGAELARVGFTEAPGLAKSEQVAVLGIERGSQSTPRQSPGVSLGLGGGGGSFGRGGGGFGGGGVGIGFPIGARSSDVTLTRMFVRIRRRSDGTVFWEGRAETSARSGSADAQPQVAVRKLAAALFRDFPGESGRTVVVK